jgi:NDP-sugar pyrophosphorylase family protein
MQPTLLILAAGIGSRYGGLKQADGMGPNGESILEFSVRDAVKAGFGKLVLVIRKDIEAEFREKVGYKVEKLMPTFYAYQEADTALEWLDQKPERLKPWGTGHAILSAKAYLTEPFIAINADDYYGPDAFVTISKFLTISCTPSTYAMVAYRLANTLSENGTVSRGVCTANAEGYLTNVIERTKIDRLEDGIYFFDEKDERHFLADDTLVSMNFWGFHHSLLFIIEDMFREFVTANMGNPKAEFYIPTVVNQQITSGAARVKVLTSDSQWYGVTYPDDKETVRAALANVKVEG